MDRNYYADRNADWVRVALRKESVDRNQKKISENQYRQVALRKESVDRNCLWVLMGDLSYESLSARRAWIEIVYPGTWSGSILVALRKESVDRNKIGITAIDGIIGRSPQGERG